MAKRPLADYHRAAQALAESVVLDDDAAAKQGGVTLRTLKKWRRWMEEHSLVREFFHERLPSLDGAWRGEFKLLLLAAARKARELVGTAQDLPDLPDVRDTMYRAGELGRNTTLS